MDGNFSKRLLGNMKRMETFKAFLENLQWETVKVEKELNKNVRR